MNNTRQILSFIFVAFGIILASLGLEGFLIPNHFIDGGVMGLAMLTSELIQQPLPLVILIINIPFVALGMLLMGWKTPIKGAISIIALSCTLHFFQFPVITNDKLLAAIFGGLFLGSGIGFAIRGGSVLDGTEILAILLHKRLHLMIGDTILIFNTIIFSLGAYYLGLEVAMYSILTYFAASKAIDFLVFGLDEHISMMIVTEKNEAIKDFLLSHSQKGVTVLKGQGGFSNQDKDILFCVMTRFELGKIKPEILKQDPNAFIITHKISFSTGGLIKQYRTMGA